MASLTRTVAGVAESLGMTTAKPMALAQLVGILPLEAVPKRAYVA